MHIVSNRFSAPPLAAIVAGIVLSALFAFAGFGPDTAPAGVSPLSIVTVEETLADRPTTAPLPGDPLPLGWTAWSG